MDQLKGYLSAKIETLGKKVKEYESPIMQELIKNSTHLQFDFIRARAELSAYESVLLTMESFICPPVLPTTPLPVESTTQQKKKRDEGKADKGKAEKQN